MATNENWVDVGSLGWFYREANPIGRTDRSPVLLLHGLISQSYSWRNVMPALAEQGFHTIAPDWIGCGYSDKPDRRDFAYTPEVLLNALEAFINTVELKKFSLVAQGFLGSVGIQYALRHPQQVERLVILNAPIDQAAKLPWKLKQMSIPLVGDMLTQNPLLVDRVLEGAGGYRIDDRDMDIYRRPWIKSSDAGRALMATLQSLQLPQVTAEIETGLTQWGQPLLLAWGVRDPWLPMAIAQTIAQTHKTAEFVALEAVGHYPQEDWHEKVSDALVTFLRRR